MKLTISLLSCSLYYLNLLSQSYPPSEYKNYISKADSLYKLKDYKNAAENYSLAFKSYGWKGRQEDRLYAARSWALAGTPDSAFHNLERIVYRVGYADYEEILSVQDLSSLHSDKRWNPLIEQVKRNKLPSGWFRWGEEQTSYMMYADSGAGQEGKTALTVKSLEDVDGFGTIMQNILPDNYSGKRVRLSGYIKTEDVKGWAGLWMRVDQEKSRRSLAFDNMQDRGVKGTTGWKKYEVVLEVPDNASNIGFGALLSGTGQMWFEKLNFEIVGKNVPLTGKTKSVPNLDFDH